MLMEPAPAADGEILYVTEVPQITIAGDGPNAIVHISYRSGRRRVGCAMPLAVFRKAMDVGDDLLAAHDAGGDTIGHAAAAAGS